MSADPNSFVSTLQPFLAAKNAGALSQYLRLHYTNEDLCAFLNLPLSHGSDVCKVAALALGLVGDGSCIPALVKRLQDTDPAINQMAEHALWNVWFRGGTHEANQDLCHGTRCLNDRAFEAAFSHFDRAIELCSDFAEAYHQRGIAWSMLEKHEKAIRDYQRTVELMPSHFCAWSGLGHAYSLLEQLPLAINAYARAREINPHMEGIGEALEELGMLERRGR